MKKTINILIAILSMMEIANAQSGWSSTEFEADELKGQPAYTALSYTDNQGNRLTMWSNEDNYFRITSCSHIFNYTVSGSLKEVGATVGFYDTSDNLIEKNQMTFWPNDDNPRIAHNSIFLSRNKKKGKKVIQYLRNEEGYIRIIAPLYRSISGFDLKVPCLKSEPQKTERDLSMIFKDGLDQLQRLKIYGIKDSSSMLSYLAYIKLWGENNSYKYGVSVNDTASNESAVLMHVEKRIYPNLVSAKTLNIPVYLLYDIEVSIDTLPFNGNIHVKKVRVRWEYPNDYSETHSAKLLELPVQQLKELPEEFRAFNNSLKASSTGTDEKNTFFLNDAWLNVVQEAEDNQTPQAKIYLDLYTAVLLSTSWLITDFPKIEKK